MRPVLETVSMRVHFHFGIGLVKDNSGKKVRAERMSQSDSYQNSNLRLDGSCERRGSCDRREGPSSALIEGGSCQVQFGEYHTMVKR